MFLRLFLLPVALLAALTDSPALMRLCNRINQKRKTQCDEFAYHNHLDGLTYNELDREVLIRSIELWIYLVVIGILFYIGIKTGAFSDPPPPY